MLNENFKAAMTIERFILSGMIGIFKASVKSDISAMKPKVETSMKWGTILRWNRRKPIIIIYLICFKYRYRHVRRSGCKIKS